MDLKEPAYGRFLIRAVKNGFVVTAQPETGYRECEDIVFEDIERLLEYVREKFTREE